MISNTIRATLLIALFTFTAFSQVSNNIIAVHGTGHHATATGQDYHWIASSGGVVPKPAQVWRGPTWPETPTSQWISLYPEDRDAPIGTSYYTTYVNIPDDADLSTIRTTGNLMMDNNTVIYVNDNRVFSVNCDSCGQTGWFNFGSQQFDGYAVWSDAFYKSGVNAITFAVNNSSGETGLNVEGITISYLKKRSTDIADGRTIRDWRLASSRRFNVGGSTARPELVYEPPYDCSITDVGTDGDDAQGHRGSNVWYAILHWKAQNAGVCAEKAFRVAGIRPGNIKDFDIDYTGDPEGEMGFQIGENSIRVIRCAPKNTATRAVSATLTITFRKP